MASSRRSSWYRLRAGPPSSFCGRTNRSLILHYRLSSEMDERLAPFELGATVQLVSGGAPMTVLIWEAHESVDVIGASAPPAIIYTCAWHDAAGVPYQRDYPDFALRRRDLSASGPAASEADT